LRGYGELMAWLYSPAEYYGRCEAYLRRAGSVSASRASTLGEVGALLRTIWHVGVRSPRRRLFWRLMGRALLRGRSKVRQAAVHAVQGEHLINSTREHVVPRMEAALAEVRAEVGASRMAQQTATRRPRGTIPARQTELHDLLTVICTGRSSANGPRTNRTCERLNLMIKLLRNSQRRYVRQWRARSSGVHSFQRTPRPAFRQWLRLSVCLR
jgi:G:T/U-mismatch repair DNA glycosylase